MTPHTYQFITIHPAATEDDSPSIDRYEVWATYEEVFKGKTYDSEGVIGWLYPLGDKATTWVWMNEAGHPTHVFVEGEDLQAWLEKSAPIVTWATKART